MQNNAAKVQTGRMNNDTAIHERTAEVLQHLIRFDTTSPPGNEDECAGYIKSILESAGIRAQLFALDRRRPNVIAHLKGEGKAPPLLMYGHMDVVTTTDQEWEQPPFAGNIVNGFLWGRGALDMKGGLAMMLSALLRMKAEKLVPPGDVIFAAVSDEEGSGDYGARFLVENHPALFDGVKYAIGEIGGFNLEISGRRFYPIQVAEKQICLMKATLRGPAGHGSMAARGTAMSKLGHMITTLERQALPVHVTPVARLMLGGMASHLPFPASLIMRMLTVPSLANTALKIMGDRGSLFDPLLHNTVNPTIVRGGNQENVIPAKVELLLDGRLLPGFTPQDMIGELCSLLGEKVELEVVVHNPGYATSDFGLFDTLSGILREQDPSAIPIPMLVSGVTDARLFSRIGIQTYGFTPMQFPAEMPFTRFFHAANERIPLAALTFGSQAIFKLLQRFGGTSMCCHPSMQEVSQPVVQQPGITPQDIQVPSGRAPAN